MRAEGAWIGIALSRNGRTGKHHCFFVEFSHSIDRCRWTPNLGSPLTWLTPCIPCWYSLRPCLTHIAYTVQASSSGSFTQVVCLGSCYGVSHNSSNLKWVVAALDLCCKLLQRSKYSTQVMSILVCTMDSLKGPQTPHNQQAALAFIKAHDKWLQSQHKWKPVSIYTVTSIRWL